MRMRATHGISGLASDPLPLTRHARVSWLREQAEACGRHADEARAAGEEAEVIAAFLDMAEHYRATAELRAAREVADG
jgi:hypothetical protein